LLHAVHETALVVVEYSPLGQVAHSRFAVVEPASAIS
jgi:hypothetical protein